MNWLIAWPGAGLQFIVILGILRHNFTCFCYDVCIQRFTWFEIYKIISKSETVSDIHNPVGNFWLQKPCIKLTLRPCNVAERFQKWCNWCTRKYFATLQKGCKQVARQCCNILAKRPKCVYVRQPPRRSPKGSHWNIFATLQNGSNINLLVTF